MTTSEIARSYLLAEIEALAPFDFVVVAPAGHPLDSAEVTRLEEGGLEVRIPGRPEIVPALEVAARSALRELGFRCEDAADSTKPWLRAVADGAEAVGVLLDVRVKAFGKKPDIAIDIVHGSHKGEHEAEQKLQIARSRIEPIVTEILGRRPEQDPDGDYVLPVGEVHVMVAPRAAPDSQIVVRIFAITNVGVQATPELGLFLARLNFGLMFGRFALDVEHRSIWFDEMLLGEEFREEELRFAIRMVATTADRWDDKLKQMFGGATYQEVKAGGAATAAPPVKPGDGAGMYL